jgi:hypothetical protein
MQRSALVRQALHDVGKVFVVGVGLDVVFQLIALRTLYSVEALLVGILLVVLPYVIIRAGVTRVLSRR